MKWIRVSISLFDEEGNLRPVHLIVLFISDSGGRIGRFLRAGYGLLRTVF
jgi:hypothetical protein